MSFKPTMLDMLHYWIVERDAIRAARAAGKPRPWTVDPVLRDNRFCNVRRMDDKVSDWLLRNWYQPHAFDANTRTLVIAATLARHLNWIPTLEYVGFPAKWSRSGMANKLHKLQRRDGRVFTGAYIINGGGKGVDKIDAVCDRVHAVGSLPAVARPCFGPRTRYSFMQELHMTLMQVHGLGSFMAGQIVADLRYTNVLNYATDALTWAPRGPGSTRGLRRLLGFAADELNRPFKDEEFLTHLRALWQWCIDNPHVNAVFSARGCELMDLQNCLCEFDKYVRIRTGEGRARNRYDGKAGFLRPATQGKLL
jgi:hypothetical protein